MLKVQEIREIIRLIDQSSITNFKYETDEGTVSLKKETSVAVTTTTTPTPVVTEAQAAPKLQEKVAPAQEKKEEKVEAEKQEETESNEGSTDYDYEVVSPMVGTFYEAPSPEDNPYVSVGDTVEPESIVCIVEAMKLFNEIEAEVNGEIVEKLVKDGELVEFGQPLFRVKKK